MSRNRQLMLRGPSLDQKTVKLTVVHCSLIIDYEVRVSDLYSAIDDSLFSRNPTAWLGTDYILEGQCIIPPSTQRLIAKQTGVPTTTSRVFDRSTC